MLTPKQLSRLNSLIGRELGRTPFGRPIYEWHQARTLQHPMRTDGFDFKATESGLLVAEPCYEIRPLAPWLQPDQWVICWWEPSMSEARWREIFGYRLEWPREGTYQPTNVDLDQGWEPNDQLTRAFIGAVKKQRAKSLADHIADGERVVEGRDHAADSKLDSMIRDSCTAFGNVPGRKMHVSFPPTSKEAN